MSELNLSDEYEYVILCEKCMSLVPEDEIEGIFAAMFGPQGQGEGRKILVCPWWALRMIYTVSEKYACDSCGKSVAVARSSNWFVEKHKAERES